MYFPRGHTHGPYSKSAIQNQNQLAPNATKPKTLLAPHFFLFRRLNYNCDYPPLHTTTVGMPSHRKTRTSPKKLPKQSKPMTYSAKQLFEAAEQAVHVQDPTQALTLFTAAISKAEGSFRVDILEKRAAVKVSLADQEGASEDYQAALDLVHIPEGGPQLASALERKAGLYMYKGQLSQGEDALSVYRQAMGLLERSLKLREEENGGQDAMQEEKSTNTLQETRQQMATACCTAAELYLTDLCYEENAEQECESYIQQALKILDNDGEPIVDALQTCASLKLSQNKGMEAVDFILRAFEKIRVGCEALASLVGMRDSANPDEATELLETEAVQKLPGFEFRCQTAKLLLECAAVLKKEQDGKELDVRQQQCVRAAIDTLGSLMAENDEVVEIWSLAGEASMATDPPSSKAAKHYWERSVEMLSSVKDSIEEQLQEVEDDDEEEELNQELEEVMCQLDSVQVKLKDIAAESDGGMEEGD